MEIKTAGCLRKVKDATKKLRNYSKQWNPGDQLHVFYPVVFEGGQWELVAGGVWGHKVNNFSELNLKTSFIPSLTQFDENGDPIGRPDVTYQFSNIAPCFVEGQFEAKKKALLAKAFPSDSARFEALQQLNHQYDAKNNPKAIKPIVSRAQFIISTEVVSIKYNNGQPVLDTAAVSSYPLSDTKLDQLYKLLNDPRFCPEEGAAFWEVEFTYPTDTDKGESGRKAAPTGLTMEYRIPHQFPNVYASLERGQLKTIATSADLIVQRSTRAVSEDKIRGAISNYCMMHCEDLDTVPDESTEQLVRNAAVIHELGFLRNLANMELVEKIKEGYASNAVQQAATMPELSAPAADLGAMSSVTPAPAPVQDLTPASAPIQDTTPTLAPAQDLTPVQPINPEAPTINQFVSPQSMVANAGFATGMSEADLEQIDLGEM